MQVGVLALEQRSGNGTAPLDDVNGLPLIRREPPITIAPDFKTVRECRDVITTLDYGQFMLAAWMVEQMLWNSRVRAVTNTRLDGLVGTEIRWEPGRLNEAGRRAARDIEEDFPLIASAMTRKQLSLWGLLLGVGFAQKHWYESPKSGRLIPRLETYHPQWGLWDWFLRAYRIWTLDGWSLVPSPALMVPGQAWQPMYPIGYNAIQKPDTLRRWVIHEPFGQHSWRHAMAKSGWRSWLGHEWANRDMSRSSEKNGVGIVKVKYPKTTDKGPLNLLLSFLRNLGRDAVIPVEQAKPEEPQSSYDAEPFEWTTTGYQIITGTKESNAADLAVLFLGHNTTAETKGASVGASAQVGNLIRGDIRISDCCNEFATLLSQVLPDWAEENYGDPGLAPIPIYVTSQPAENVAASQTLQFLAVALQTLRQNAPGVDFTELLNRFRIPMKPGGAQVKPPDSEPEPGALPPPNAPKEMSP